MNEEYVIVVDEKNRIMGQEKRRIVHESGAWHRGVHVFLFTPDQRLLVQRRSSTQDTCPGAWDCSVSEHLNPGESYFEGAVRGLREELGVEGVELRRLLQLMMPYGPNDNMANELYEGVADEGLLRWDHREIAEIGFSRIQEVEEEMARGDVPFTPWFVQLFRWYTGKPVDMKIRWSAGAGDGRAGVS